MNKTRVAAKRQSNSQTCRFGFRKLPPAVLFLATFLACAVCCAGTSKLYPPDKDQAGTLRLAQVNRLASRTEILASGASLRNLLASGLKDSDLEDGSLASGRVFCCHRSVEEGTELWFYVPPDVTVQVGDIVVVRMGRESTKQDPGAVNAVTEVREKKDAPDSKCSWDPPKEYLWRRVLYCSWMPAEGWTLMNGSHKTWLKRTSDAKPQ